MRRATTYLVQPGVIALEVWINFGIGAAGRQQIHVDNVVLRLQ